MASDSFNTSDKQFRENINFIKDLFYPNLTSNSSPNQMDVLSNWPTQPNTSNEMRSTPGNSALQTLTMLANRESGMTPTPTNDNSNSYRSPKVDINTPKTALLGRGGQQHSTPAPNITPSHQLSPGDSSGISTGTDASDGSFRSSGSHRWPTSFSSIPASTSPIQMGAQSKSLQSPTSGINNNLIDPLLLNSLSSNERSIAENKSLHRFPDVSSVPASNASLKDHLQQLLSSSTTPVTLSTVSPQQISDTLTEQQMNEMLMTMLYNSYLGGTADTANTYSQHSADDLRQLYQQELLLRYLSNPLAAGGGSTSLSGLIPNLSPLLNTPDISLNNFGMGGSGLSLSNTSPAANASALNMSNFSDTNNLLSPTGLGTNLPPAGANSEFMDDVNAMSGFYRRMIGPMMGEIEKAACQYRNSANSVSQKCEVPFNWTGKLPARVYKNSGFSRKVFLGGVPWDSTSDDLVAAFNCFGAVSVMWPQKEGSTVSTHNPSKPKGYCYLIFENENSVRLLLNTCARDSNGGDYFKIASPKFRSKDVQVIPWVINDSQFNKLGSHRPDMKRTVFIGALHGMITAEALATIMDDLFGNVAFCALDTDKYKYPIGSGRVAFSNQKSYVRAVTANFVDVRTAKFAKTIQIDPYLEDNMCNNCFAHAGVYFCRAFECFRYFCPACWHVWHNSAEGLYNHKPLRRTFKAAAQNN